MAKTDFESEIRRIKEGKKRIAEIRQKAAEMQKSSNTEEKKMNARAWDVLCDQLLKNGIDPLDLKFIVNACVEAKLHSMAETGV